MTAVFDAAAWVARWDAQQAGHVPGRERVFDLMLDVIENLGGTPRRVLDLGCGPGSLSSRVLARFPDAEVVAVDADPVMLELGERTLGERVRFVRADLSDPGWTDAVAATGFDAAVSATALHWLPAVRLAQFAGGLAGLLRPDGVFLNFDTLRADAARTPRLAAATEALRSERTEARTTAPGFEDFYAWWDAAQREPELAGRFAEKAGLSLGGHGGSSLAQWEQALTGAGFAEVGTMTQLLDRRLLAALR